MKARIKRVQPKRVFSEEFRRSLVKEYEKGTYSVVELEKLYGIGNSLIYGWIYKYSHYNKKSVKIVEMKDSQVSKLMKLEARVNELEQAVGKKQLTIDYLEKMMDIANEELGIDIKKNFNTLQSTGLKETKK